MSCLLQKRLITFFTWQLQNSKIDFTVKYVSETFFKRNKLQKEYVEEDI